MASLVLAAFFFAGIHLGIAGTRLRDSVIGAIGRAYRAVFSMASLTGLIWLIFAYNHAPYLPTWGIPEWWKPRRSCSCCQRFCWW
jgi:uncharacterized membrane protein